ncbi:protein FAM53C isoform X1 [Oncorhynchus kisutch]|uniref:Family with sequence similarity 53 member C n=1 Tax=Oncorhynchus kisutch TaxID=8019 RepID=A0A8C7JV20_ONCKI|nr:protein FAM53C isoform X1 [Oncorhynchus kisutch]XP_031645756.1 protein FAM53C isoform X1 [Oncorhynchus kisutch]
MVTLITEQLRKQNLEEPPYHRAFSLNVSLPEVGSSPTVCWRGCGLTPESSWSMFPSSKTHMQDASVLSSLDPLGTPFTLPSTSVTDLSLQSSPPPPPPKRHCRSLSVPEDLSHCRSPWRPSASKIWTPVKRRCHSGGGVACMGVGSLVGSIPLRGPSSSLTSSLTSSSSPTFFSLAMSPDSPLPWGCPWDHNDLPRGGCTGFFPAPSSCSSSPASLGSCRPLLQRRFSLSPVHVLPPQPSPSPAPGLVPRYPSMEPPAPSPSSACSSPSSSRRDLPPCLPRCHSQPCDLRKPGLKRRHDADTLPYYVRPGLDFNKMTPTRVFVGNLGSLARRSGATGSLTPPSHEPELLHSHSCPSQTGPVWIWVQGAALLIRSGEPLVCGAAVYMGLEPVPGDFRGAFSPADLGRTSIGPLSESEEEENINMGAQEAGQQSVFERDCTELNLNLIEEN